MNPILWYGGKPMLAKRIAKSLPDHETYVEPFCGSAAVLRAKWRADVEIVTDLNPVAVALLQAVRDHPEQIEAVAHGITKERWFDAQSQCYLATPHGKLSTKAQHDEAVAALDAGTLPLAGTPLGVEAWIATACSFNGRLTGNRIGDTWFSARGAKQAEGRAKGIRDAQRRLQGVDIFCADGMAQIDAHSGDENTLLFIDPPYMYEKDGGGSRTFRSTYGIGEVGRDWHGDLIDRLLAARCAVVLTTGDDDDYKNRLADWECEPVYGLHSDNPRHLIWRNR